MLQIRALKNVETLVVDTLISWDFGKSSIFASNTTEALTKLLIGTVFREKHVSEVCLWFRHFLDLKQKGFDTQGGYLELTRWFCGILVNAEHLRLSRPPTVTGFEFEQFTPNCKLQNTTGTSKTFVSRKTELRVVLCGESVVHRTHFDSLPKSDKISVSTTDVCTFLKVTFANMGAKSLDICWWCDIFASRLNLVSSPKCYEVNTVSVGLVFHELYEKIIFDF